MARKFKVRKGDEVVVTKGRDKGKRGEVLSVQRDDNRVTVAGVNMVSRHQRPTQTAPGGITQKEAPIEIANVALADSQGRRPRPAWVSSFWTMAARSGLPSGPVR